MEAGKTLGNHYFLLGKMKHYLRGTRRGTQISTSRLMSLKKEGNGASLYLSSLKRCRDSEEGTVFSRGKGGREGKIRNPSLRGALGKESFISVPRPRQEKCERVLLPGPAKTKKRGVREKGVEGLITFSRLQKEGGKREKRGECLSLVK